MAFDSQLRYQFGLFFREDHGVSSAALTGVADAVSSPRDGPNLGLSNFGTPETQGQLVLAEGHPRETVLFTWKAGGGVWRLTWGNSRLDVHFDARGYGDLVEQPVRPLKDVIARVVPGLAAALRQLSVSPFRLALIVVAADSCGGDFDAPARIVRNRFLREGLVGPDDRLLDATVRVNRAIDWTMSNDTILVNRIETATATWALRGDVPETALAWQLDVNTSPRRRDELPAQMMAEFYERAATWETERLSAVERELGDG